MTTVRAASALALLIWLAPAFAQEAQEPATVAPATGSRRPAPGEEVMRPTKHGVRLTPGLAQLFTQAYLDEMIHLREVDPKQMEQLSKVAGRRMLEVAHRRGPEAQAAAEAFAWGMLMEHRPMDAQTAARLAGELRPGLQAFREWHEGLPADAETILDDQQMAEFRSGWQAAAKAMDAIEAHLDRWSRGEVEERPELDEVLDKAEEAYDNERNAESKSGEARNAARMARRQVEEHGLESLRRFWFMVKLKFELTPEQIAVGENLLAEHKHQAGVIMTPEWMGRARRNRTLANARWSLRDQQLQPWVFKLDQEFEAMNAPLRKLGLEYREKLLGLPTPEQYAKALADIQAFGRKHGMSDAELSCYAQVLAPTSRPADASVEQASEIVPAAQAAPEAQE